MRTLRWGIFCMSHYRRCYVPGGSFFFTVVTDRRAPILGTDLARDLLRAAFRDCFDRWPPFRVDAMVMLDNHLHAIWTLPPDDSDYSKRWGAIKKHFTQSWLVLGGSEKPLTASRVRHRRRGVWQPRFLRQAQDRFGNLPCAMNGIMPGILITSTTIR